MIRGAALFLDPKMIIVNAAIYPADVFSIIRSPYNVNYQCTEQLVQPYKALKWQDELAPCRVFKDNNNYTMYITKPYEEGTPEFYYNFTGVQKDMFEHGLNYVLNFGMQLTGQYKMKM